MAISALHYCIVRELFGQGVLPQGGAILELGEANWYGDGDPADIMDDIRSFVSDPARREALLARLQSAVQQRDKASGFEVAKIIYEIYFAPCEIQAVDYGGTATAHKFDLNEPIQLDRRFQVVINHGTAEHIFNIGQVFRTMHDYAVPGGMMIHESPFTGWIDHGFYTLQPTLFFDIAEANQYRLVLMCIEDTRAFQALRIPSRDTVYQLVKSNQLPENGMLFTVLIKHSHDRPFRVPVQGYYRHALSDVGMAAWRELR
jgi:hypothetical protein